MAPRPVDSGRKPAAAEREPTPGASGAPFPPLGLWVLAATVVVPAGLRALLGDPLLVVSGPAATAAHLAAAVPWVLLLLLPTGLGGSGTGLDRESAVRALRLLVGIAVLSAVVGAIYLVAPGVSVGFVGPEAPDGATADAPHPVGACTTLSEPGRYVLTTDLESDGETCLEVVASDVILDGGGHVVRGRLAQGSTAVAVGPPADGGPAVRNVTVRNLSVRNWVFGVVYTGVAGGTVTDVRTFHNVEGVTVSDSTGVTVADTRVREGCVGLDVVRSSAVRIEDTTVEWLSIVGVSVVDSRGLALANVTVAHAEVGIALRRAADVSYTDVTVTDAEGREVPVGSPPATADCPVDCDGPRGRIGCG